MFSPGMLISLHIYLYIFAVAAVIMALLGIFKSSIYNRLSTRIALLILASGPIATVITLLLDNVLPQTLQLRWRLLQTTLIVLGSPVILGTLAALFVRRPLRQFDEAMASLEQSNYKVQLRQTGIDEFDKLFTKFNNLINRLQHEEKLRKDLVSDTSHELHTPLTTMIGQLTAIQDKKYAPTDERIAMLKEQAERLAELIQQLDAYTKARVPDTEEPEDIRLKQFCDDLIKHFSLELKEKGIAVHVHITDEYTLHASRTALQQILTNLLQNALRYSEATEVTIEATAHKLTFADNGKGVPAESLPYLFERFYRVDKSRSRASGGLGLGLAIVKELTEGQGWGISAKAGHPGLVFMINV